MRLIDADALVEQVCLDGDCTQCKTGVNEKVCKWNMFQLKDVIDCLEHASNIDAEPVIRCKDCRWQEECSITELWGGGNGYCRSGERKDNE